MIIEDVNQTYKSDVGFVFHPFVETKDNPSIFISAHYRCNSTTLNDALFGEIKKMEARENTDAESEIIEINYSEYEEGLEQGISEIRHTNLEKFIFSRIEIHPKKPNFEPLSILQTLRNNHPNAFIYYLHHPISGTWMGATPETLANWHNGIFSTMSLAGTQPLQNGEVIWKPKEIDEQAYVTAFIEDVFQKENISYLKSETETVAAGPVVHLKTALQSDESISFNQALQLVDSLHPTPAVCGVPRKKALETITLLETHQRSYYTGYLGLVYPERELNLFVNLRCMRVLSKSIALYLGGGITAESEVQKEWEETQQKAKTLLSAL
jgi:isochorismate synthase